VILVYVVVEKSRSAQSNVSGRFNEFLPAENPSEPLKVGVIGVGNMGQHHTRVLSLLKDVQLVGVSDINVERGLDTASKYRVRFF
jgi:predicted homoserine dehydrogenase-like protein